MSEPGGGDEDGGGRFVTGTSAVLDMLPFLPVIPGFGCHNNDNSSHVSDAWKTTSPIPEEGNPVSLFKNGDDQLRWSFDDADRSIGDDGDYDNTEADLSSDTTLMIDASEHAMMQREMRQMRGLVEKLGGKLETNTRNLNKRVEELENGKRVLTTRVEKLEIEKKTLTDRVTTLSSRNFQLQREMDETRASSVLLQTSVNRLTKENVQLTTRVKGLQTELNDVREENSVLRGQNASLQATVNSLDSSFKEACKLHTDTIDNLRSALRGKDEIIANLEHNLKMQEGISETQSETIGFLKCQNANLQERLDNRRRAPDGSEIPEVSNLQRELTQLRAEKAEVEAERNTLRQTVVRQDKQLTDSEEKKKEAAKDETDPWSCFKFYVLFGWTGLW